METLKLISEEIQEVEYITEQKEGGKKDNDKDGGEGDDDGASTVNNSPTRKVQIQSPAKSVISNKKPSLEIDPGEPP